MSISLRLPDDVKRRIQRLADQKEMTPHAFMLAAIEEKVDAEEQHLAFIKEGEQRLVAMKASRSGIPANEVFAFLKSKAAGKPARRPRERRIK